jgi:hypothetical protein
LKVFPSLHTGQRSLTMAARRLLGTGTPEMWCVVRGAWQYSPRTT